MLLSVKTKKGINKKRLLFILCCVALPTISWLLQYVYANIASIAMAFQGNEGQFTLENFVRFFEEFQKQSSDIRIAFKNTFLTFGILLIAFPFKILVSYFIYKKVPFYGFYRIVFFLPSIIASVCISLVFSNIIGVEGFIAEGVQQWLGLDYAPEFLADTRFANTVVLLHMLWLGFPGDLIIWGGTFARIPEELLESARIDGVNWWKEFTRIVVPMVWPTVALQMVLTFCGIFSASGAVFLLTEGEFGTMTITAWMYIQLYKNSGNMYTSSAYNYMSAVGLLLTIVAITISLVIRRTTDKVFEEVEF